MQNSIYNFVIYNAFIIYQATIFFNKETFSMINSLRVQLFFSSIRFYYPVDKFLIDDVQLSILIEGLTLSDLGLLFWFWNDSRLMQFLRCFKDPILVSRIENRFLRIRTGAFCSLPKFSESPTNTLGKTVG